MKNSSGDDLRRAYWGHKTPLYREDITRYQHHLIHLA